MSKTLSKPEKHSILEKPLSELSAWPTASSPQVTLSEVPFQGQFVLRSLDTLKDLNEKLEPVLGLALSNTPNKAVSKKGLKVFWLREGHWMIVTSTSKRDQIAGQLDKALSGMDSSVVDNSAGQTVIKLHGDKARETLIKGCPLDLHPSAFKTGHMAQSRIMHADILLHRSSKDNYDLYIRKSFAEYLLRWLHDAALEFGVVVESKESP